MLGNLITITTFSQVIDAQLAETKLEPEGIECLIVNESTFSIDWLYPIVVGDIRLQVNGADARRAIEILHQADSMDDVVGENNEHRCPNCNSSDVHYKKSLQRFGFAHWLLLFIAFPFLKRKWKCTKCGYQWKKE